MADFVSQKECATSKIEILDALHNLELNMSKQLVLFRFKLSLFTGIIASIGGALVYHLTMKFLQIN
jgi:hypothetical protein